MKIVVQLYDKIKGTRSQAMTVERTQLAKQIIKSGAAGDIELDNIIVIVVMEHYNDEWQFTLAPLFNANDFIKWFGEHENVREEIQSTTEQPEPLFSSSSG